MKHSMQEGMYHCVAKNRVNQLHGYLTLEIMSEYKAEFSIYYEAKHHFTFVMSAGLLVLRCWYLGWLPRPNE